MIIRGNKSFEGSEFKTAGGSYLKPGIRVMNFRDKTIMDGAYVLILEAYKEDSSGNGVWYKPLKVRDNFGLDTKEKFAVQPNCPVDWFASKIKAFAPHLAKVEKTTGDDGKTRMVYPPFGRTTYRVLYNAAFFNNQGAGAHILDLPQSGGASVIADYSNGRQPDGSENPRINDYTSAIPVFIKLDMKAVGNPWKITVNNTKTYSLPEALADTEYLYNLDDAIQYPSKEELIEKLRGIVPPDIFAKAMDGYSDGTVKVSMAMPTSSTRMAAPGVPALPSPEEDDIPFNSPAPVQAAPPKATIAKATIPTAAKPVPTSVAPAFNLPKAGNKVPAPVAAPQEEPTADEQSGGDDELPTPPVPSTPKATLASARNFISRPTAG